MPRSVSVTDSLTEFAPIDDELLGSLLDDSEEPEPEKSGSDHGPRVPRGSDREALTKLEIPPDLDGVPIDVASRDKVLCSRLEGKQKERIEHPWRRRMPMRHESPLLTLFSLSL